MNKKNCAFLVPAALLVACASEPAPRPAPAPAPVSLTKVYFYPLQGQSGAQQDRDRYECFNWSVRQTGFDPSRRVAPDEQRATVVPARSAGPMIATTAADVPMVCPAERAGTTVARCSPGVTRRLGSKPVCRTDQLKHS